MSKGNPAKGENIIQKETETYFASNATFFARRIPAQDMFATETRGEWTLFHRVVDGGFLIKESFCTYPQTSDCNMGESLKYKIQRKSDEEEEGRESTRLSMKQSNENTFCK